MVWRLFAFPVCVSVCMFVWESVAHDALTLANDAEFDVESDVFL